MANIFTKKLRLKIFIYYTWDFEQWLIGFAEEWGTLLKL